MSKPKLTQSQAIAEGLAEVEFAEDLKWLAYSYAAAIDWCDCGWCSRELFIKDALQELNNADPEVVYEFING